MKASSAETLVLRAPGLLSPEMPAPFSSRVKVDFGALSHAGKVRPSNEDSYLIFRTGRFFEPLHTSLPPDQLPGWFEENGYLMAVADGMGGHQAGEVASSLALRTAVALVLNAAQWALKLDNPQERSHEILAAIERGVEYFRKIHRTVADAAKSDPALARMGTTLTAAYSFGGDLFVLHVGDSRAYLFRGGRLRQLTRDDTAVQVMVEAGTLSPAEAARHRLRHMLTQAIGGSTREVRTEVEYEQLADGDCVLLCSDGLTGMVGDGRIAEVLARGDPAEATCQALVGEALAAGGKDNVTALVARYRLPQAAG